MQDPVGIDSGTRVRGHLLLSALTGTEPVICDIKSLAFSCLQQKSFVALRRNCSNSRRQSQPTTQAHFFQSHVLRHFLFEHPGQLPVQFAHIDDVSLLLAGDEAANAVAKRPRRREFLVGCLRSMDVCECTDRRGAKARYSKTFWKCAPRGYYAQHWLRYHCYVIKQEWAN